MPDGKYVTFKMGDWEHFLRTHVIQDLEEKIIEDAVVIRRQDVFASPALDVYAGCITVAVKMMAPGPKRDNLVWIADYFHEQAVLASQVHSKVPD